MNFISTRGSQIYSIDEVLAKGIADDGGLFIPKVLPKINHEDLSNSMTLIDTAQVLLAPFFRESLIFKITSL